MSRDRYVVKGPQGVANRLEINDFIKNEAHFSLYVQALIKLQQKDQKEVDSFFQIGGIHGLPAAQWDPDSPRGPGDDQQWLGYCTHGDVLFPTWHRPYMILMEQAIQDEATKIAETYTYEKECFIDAARNLRQPYWDWAKKSVPPPEVISMDSLTIRVFDGEKGSVANPFRRYTFNPLLSSFKFPKPFDMWQTTLRHPKDPNATEDINQLICWMQSAQTDIRDKTYIMLTQVHTWPEFSHHTASKDSSKDTKHALDDGYMKIKGNSLEAIHDAIHVNIGGGGHMGDPTVAGFDPIFYMHHAQVDRLLAIWATLNPNVWVTPSTSKEGTWTLEQGSPIDTNTDLTPFWNAEPTYWTSAKIMDTASLGYTYPDFNVLPEEPTGPLPNVIAEKINRLYAGATFERLSPKTAISGSQDRAAQSKVWEWTARIRVKKYEVGVSFGIPLFVGSVPENLEEWLTSENFVGAQYTFVNSTPESCGNCRTQQNVTIEGFVHLNDVLIRRSGLESLESSDVVPYLKENLHWRAIKASGEAIELSRLPSLEVEVTATRLTLPPGSIFPVAEETIIYHEITEGKQGGARSGEA
ncbi:hypothetical protein PM082_019866 [Marasmius tenuissimus]|nr:hypothetical protein PM082_019866 [Marasmius tenuissimus]